MEVLSKELSDKWQMEFYGVDEIPEEPKKRYIVGMKDGKPVTEMLTESEWKEFNKPKEMPKSKSNYDPDGRYNIRYGRHGTQFANQMYGR